jgi:hypothetical protein
MFGTVCTETYFIVLEEKKKKKKGRAYLTFINCVTLKKYRGI